MPGEPTLADHYDFAPIVIRNALKQLQDWGLVESAAGGRVLASPEALFDGVILSGVDTDGAVVGELLALDPRYVLCSYRPDPDHLRTLIKAERIPILTHLLGTVTDPARWLTAVLWSPVHETAPAVSGSAVSGSAGCTLLINTDVTSPKAAARSLHALAMG
jgi:Bacterial regulatory proteins, gntR family